MLRPFGSSWTGPARPTRPSPGRTWTSPRSPGSAPAWTGCRWLSNWPPRGCPGPRSASWPGTCGTDTPGRDLSSCGLEFFAVAPGRVLVIDGAGLEAAVQDAYQTVGQPPERVVVLESFGALLVVERAGPGRGKHRRERPGHERVDEPVVADEPGSDDLLLARGAGDGAGTRVVLAGLGGFVAVRVVAELCEHPGAEDGCHAGLGLVDLSVRVPAKMLLHLRFEESDLLVESDQDGDQGPYGRGVGRGQRGGLAEVLAAQRGQDRAGPVLDVMAAGALERGGHLGAGQLRRPGRVRRLGQQFQRVRGIEVIERLQRGGEVLPQLVPQPLHRPGAVPDHRLVRAGHHF